MVHDYSDNLGDIEDRSMLKRTCPKISLYIVPPAEKYSTLLTFCQGILRQRLVLWHPLGNDGCSLPMQSQHYELVECTSTQRCCTCIQNQTQSSKLDPPSASAAWPHNTPSHTTASCSMCFQIDAVSSSMAQPARRTGWGCVGLHRSQLSHQHVCRNAQLSSRN